MTAAEGSERQRFGDLAGFLDRLAEGTPTPGGGSVAALAGALSTALTAMVCRLTLGKAGYEAHAAEFNELLKRAERLRAELIELVDEDAAAFDEVMSAYRAPKGEARTARIQEALMHAAEVPFKVMSHSNQALELASVAVEKGNATAITDAGVAALLACAAGRGAAMNVEINLSTIKDEAYVRSTRADMDRLLREAVDLEHNILNNVKDKLKN